MEKEGFTKVVIIDDVDVSRCDYYEPDEMWTCADGEYTYNCEECHDCYYKQLKRLQKDYKVQENIINNLNNEVDYLDKENDKYRQAIEQIRQVVEFAIEETLTIGQKNATDKILEIIRDVQDDENI